MGDCEVNTSKQRLRPWLEALLNNSSIPGLCWLNDDKTKFKVPWYHHGRPNWSKEKGQIFMEWARHTGRYREGIESEDWVVWKTRLRCAMTKAPDIKELKGESKEQDDTDPYRVFELQPRQASKAKKPLCYAADYSTVSNNPPLQLPSEITLHQTPLPLVLQQFEDEVVDSLPPDLKNIPRDQLFFDIDNHLSESFLQMSIDGSINLNNLADAHVEQRSTTAATADNWNLVLSLFYCCEEIHRRTVTKKNGFRLHYGETLAIETVQPSILALIFSNDDESKPESIWLPPCTGLMLDKRMEDQVQHVLEKGMEGGIYIRMHNGNILVSRFCKCSIFFASNIGTNGLPNKLLRDKELSGGDQDAETIVFDYSRSFQPALDRYRDGKGPRPDPYVYLMIGSEKNLSELNKNVPIIARVSSQRAETDLNSICSNVENVEEQAMSTSSLKFDDFTSDQLKFHPNATCYPDHVSKDDLNLSAFLNEIASDFEHTKCVTTASEQNTSVSARNDCDLGLPVLVGADEDLFSMLSNGGSDSFVNNFDDLILFQNM